MQPGTRVKITNPNSSYYGKLATVKAPGEYLVIDGQTTVRTYRDSDLQIVTAPSPTSPTPTGWKTYVEFPWAGAHGAPWDPSVWINRGDSTEGFLGQCASKAANCFQNGQGHGVIRTRRESFLGKQYTTGLACTFSYGYAAAGNTAGDGAWPPKTVLKSFPTPHRIEVPIRLPNLPGFWGGGWLMAVDQHRETQGVPELDFAELRRSANRHDAHQHLWRSGGEDKTKLWDGAVAASLDLLQWHTYWCEVSATSVRYGVDATAGPSCPWGRAAKWGLVLQGGIGNVGSWGAAGGQPASSDPGPWDTLVGTVRVLIPA